MRGSVTELMKNTGYRSILGADGCVIYFDEKALGFQGAFGKRLGRMRRTVLGRTCPGRQGQAYCQPEHGRRC